MFPKKFSIIITVAALALIQLSCSSSGKVEHTMDSDTVVTETRAPEQDSVTIAMPILTVNGLIYNSPLDSMNNIRIGISLDSIPKEVPGLYNRIVRDASEDAEIISCYAGREKMFDIYSFDSGLVDMISLSSPRIKATGNIEIGMPVAELLKLSSGVSTEWISLDDAGKWYWRINGLWILPDEENLSERVSSALNDKRIPPSLSILPPDTEVCYIATGVPF